LLIYEKNLPLTKILYFSANMVFGEKCAASHQMFERFAGLPENHRIEFFRNRRSSGNFCVAPVLDPNVLKYAAVFRSVGS
jgi:hypothetical protein